MTIPSTNISLIDVATEVEEGNEFNISLNTYSKRFLIDNTTLDSQISMSQFANKTGVVSWMAVGQSGSTSNDVDIVKAVRNTATSYPYYFLTDANLVTPTHYIMSALSNDGLWLAVRGYFTALPSPGSGFVDLWYRDLNTNFWSIGSSWSIPADVRFNESAPMAWDPSGTYLAWPGGKDTSASASVPVYVLKRTGTNWSEITVPTTNTYPTTGSMSPALVAWSPDGGTLAVWCTLPSTSTNSLFRYTRSGDTLTALSALASGNVPASGALVYGFSYSPDGSKAVLTWNGSSTNRMFRYDISGTSWSRVDLGSGVAAGATDLTWSPDGATIFGIGANPAVGLQTWSVSGTTYTRQTLIGASLLNSVYCDTAYHMTDGGRTDIFQARGSNPTWSILGGITGTSFSGKSLSSASRKSVPGSR